LLLAILATVTAVVAGFAFRQSGFLGVKAALVAGSVCWTAASLALIAAFIGHRRQAAVHGILIGTFIRIGLPLAAGIALQNQRGELAAAGVFPMIVGIYFFALVTETVLSLRFVPPSVRHPAKAV
jgi:hypothetical protein